MRGAKKIAFAAFDRGLRPSQLDIKGIKRVTIYRYRQLWKRQKGIPPSSGQLKAPGNGSTETANQSMEGRQGGVLTTHFEQFRARQTLNNQSGKLGVRVEELLDTLNKYDEYFEQSAVANERWKEEREQLDGQLKDFVLAQLGKIELQEDLEALTNIVDEVESRLTSLAREFYQKIKDKEEMLKQQKIETSQRLLAETLSSDLFPPWFISAINDRILVTNEGEADTVLVAISQYGLYFDDSFADGKAKWEKICNSFIKELNKDPWTFIRRLEKRCDDLIRSMNESARRMYGEWLYCPQCWAKYRVSAGPTPAVYRCTRCWSAIHKTLHGPVAFI